MDGNVTAMRARRSWVGWGIVVWLVGSPVWSAEPDPDAVRQLMKKYEQETEAGKPAPESVPVVDHDREAWQSAEKCGTTACFRAYLEEYPKGRYAKMARARLDLVPKPSMPAPAGSVIAPEMVRIPGGCFQMGSQETEPDRFGDEPQHEVCVKDFEIGVYEVTQGQWWAMMGDNPSAFKQDDNYPVENVSWSDVQVYLNKLNQETSRNYRLPTEAEWEYACWGGVAWQTYCGGNDVGWVAWHDGNSGGRTHPVGQKAANGFGLYDMSGNVWEWTCSLYDKDYGGAERKCEKKRYVYHFGCAWRLLDRRTREGAFRLPRQVRPDPPLRHTGFPSCQIAITI